MQKLLRLTPGCLRRFGQAIGRCKATTPAQTVAERNRAEGKARTRFCVARAAQWAAKRKQYC